MQEAAAAVAQRLRLRLLVHPRLHLRRRRGGGWQPVRRGRWGGWRVAASPSAQRCVGALLCVCSAPTQRRAAATCRRSAPRPAAARRPARPPAAPPGAAAAGDARRAVRCARCGCTPAACRAGTCGGGAGGADEWLGKGAAPHARRPPALAGTLLPAAALLAHAGSLPQPPAGGKPCQRRGTSSRPQAAGGSCRSLAGEGGPAVVGAGDVDDDLAVRAGREEEGAGRRRRLGDTAADGARGTRPCAQLRMRRLCQTPRRQRSTRPCGTPHTRHTHARTCSATTAPYR